MDNLGAMLLVVAMMLLVGGGLFGLVSADAHPRLRLVGPATGVLGGVMAFWSALPVLIGQPDWEIKLEWPIPMGAFHLGMDALSAFFVVAIAFIGMLAAVYGSGYLSARKDGKHVAISWFYFLLLMASMLMVATARNGLLFLMAWEIMSLSSFFLVMFEDAHAETRRAGWVYLIATHMGTAFLLVMFILLAGTNTTLDFAGFHSTGGSRLDTAIFILAVIGFGTKAGFIPFHVWLPSAHPAAPSHVSALMSGIMIKTGIYGILRIISLLGLPPNGWGWLLIGIGAVSGIMGVLLALSQHDLKRLLAYHSVENIGIITLGIGLGLIGLAYGNLAAACLGLMGGLLHVWNHAIFKSLLFFGAGSVAHGTGTREIDALGGLLKRMPATGASFMVGSAAISGLPPFNGFVSEFLIYLGAFYTLSGNAPVPGLAAAGVVVIGSLAMIGGLAAACFTKALGVVFLGEPRTRAAAAGHEAGPGMRTPMQILAIMCLLVGLAGPLLLDPLFRVVVDVAPALARAEHWDLVFAKRALCGISAIAGFALALVFLIGGFRKRLLAHRQVDAAPTWDCGYIAPTARMQYTASSFAAPMVQMVQPLLRPQMDIKPCSDLFPEEAALHTHMDDPVEKGLYAPVFGFLAKLAGKLHGLQQGRNQLYVLYIALTIVILLIWKLS